MEIDKQREEILSWTGHALIEGGPGCGKTTIALVKAAKTLQTLRPEQRVLFLSFSRAAIRQILNRTKDVLDREARERLEVRTFHAFFLDMVRSHSALLTGQPATFIAPDRAKHREADYEGTDWQEEVRRLAAEGTFVFEQLAPTAAELLSRWEPVRALYQQRYPLVIVDEFQDTDESQWRAVRLIAERSTVLCLADPEQRIYDFVEGVSETRIDDMVADLSPKRFDLSGDNHRSPQSGILSYANAVGRATPADVPDEVKAFSYQYDGMPRTHALVLAVQAKLTEDLGHAPSLAVLAPTNRLISQVSDELSEIGTFDGRALGPVEHALLLDHALTTSAAYVVASLLEWPNAEGSEGVIRTLNLMADYYRVKFAGGTSGARGRINALLRAAQAIGDGRPPRGKAGRALLESADAGVALTGRPIRDWAFVLSKMTGATELNEVAKSAKLLRVVRPTDPVTRTLAELWDGVRSYPGAAEAVRRYLAEEMLSVNEQSDSLVQLMNMHKSKGKEFDGVIIVEGEHHSRLLDLTRSEKDQAAQRRVLRVALTRARFLVVLLRPRGAPPLTPLPSPGDAEG